jgi:hypothetical protein
MHITKLDEVGKGSSEEQLTAYKNSFNDTQQWKVRRCGCEDWVLLPVRYQPGWFYDCEYEMI